VTERAITELRLNAVVVIRKFSEAKERADDIFHIFQDRSIMNPPDMIRSY